MNMLVRYSGTILTERLNIRQGNLPMKIVVVCLTSCSSSQIMKRQINPDVAFEAPEKHLWSHFTVSSHPVFPQGL